MSPTGPRPAERSVFDGIGRRQVGRSDLVAHSVAMLTPSLTALGAGLMLPRVVGPGFWLSTLLGFGLALLIALVLEEFASRFSAGGSAYTYVAKGLGAGVALAVGVSLIIGYAAMLAFGLTGATGRFLSAWEATGNSRGGAGLWAIMVLVAAGLCLMALRRGVAWSTRVTLAIEVVAVALLVLVLVMLLVRYGPPGFTAFSLEGASPSRILGGVALIATLTVTFESCSTLGLEAERPLAAVPGSMRTSLLLTGGLFLAANLVGAALPAGDRPQWRWFIEDPAVASPLDALALLVLAASMMALALCSWTALSRLVFSFAREGILPRSLGHTDAHGVPIRAVLWIAPIAVAVPWGAAALGGDRMGAGGALLDSSTLVMCVTYALAAVALVPFLRRLDELRVRTVVLAVVTCGCVLAVAARQVWEALAAPAPGALVALAIAVGAGVVWRIALIPRPQLVDRVGLHDTAVNGHPLGKETGGTHVQ